MDVPSPLSVSPLQSRTPSPLPSRTPSPLPSRTPSSAWASIQQQQQSIEIARDRIDALIEAMKPLILPSLEAMLESPNPSQSLLQDDNVATEIVGRLIKPSSGHSHDVVCRWLYDTFQTFDPGLQNVVLRYMPVLCGVYLPRVTRQGDKSVAGFEAVLLALFASQIKSGPIIVNIPDLSQSSLYHIPLKVSASPSVPRQGQLSSPLEPQDTIKATKRACVVSVALDLFFSKIASMPERSKIEACQYALKWASLSSIENSMMPIDAETILNSTHFLTLPSPFQHLSETDRVTPFLGSKISTSRSGSARYDHNRNKITDVSSSLKRFTSLRFTFGEGSQERIPSETLVDINTKSKLELPLKKESNDGATRVPLTWELFRPLVKILGHCLLGPLNTNEVRNAASVAIKALHSRAFHDVLPEAIIATRSLMRLDMVAKDATVISKEPLLSDPGLEQHNLHILVGSS